MPSRYTRARAFFSRGRKSSKNSLRRAGASGQEEEQMVSSSAILLPQSPMEIIEQEQLAWQIGRREWEVTQGYSIILYIILYPPLVKPWGVGGGGLKSTQDTLAHQTQVQGVACHFDGRSVIFKPQPPLLQNTQAVTLCSLLITGPG